MEILGIPILTLVVFLPLFGSFLLLFFSEQNRKGIRALTFVILLADFIVSLLIWSNFNGSTADMQFVEKHEWIESLGISYFMGIDGISLLLVMLTTFLGPIVALSTWKAIEKKVKEFNIFLMMLQTGILGVFVSLDLVLFYFFWEGMLIPMYFIIGIWGGPRRIYATVKFFIFTMVGSVLMLVAILAIYFVNHSITGEYTFDLIKLLSLNLPINMQVWMFFAFALAFAIKVPLFPLHTWLPDAHVEAPTAGSVVLAAVLLKMGTYGFVRFCLPMFPNAVDQFTTLFFILAVIGIIYGAMVAMVQPDVKKLVAYSSVSHLGFVILGLFTLNTQGVEGGIIQMINHGLSTGALFLVVGMIYERRHTREISEFGGLAKVMPIYATFFMIVMLSSAALPGLNGFIGEFLILVGTFKVSKLFAALAATGMILAAVYLFWMYQRMFFGEVKNEKNKGLKDLEFREIALLVPIVIMFFWIGLHPNTFLKKTEKSVEALIKNAKQKQELVLKQEIKNEELTLKK
jgi:NADH-quinone oxidoreductase subunit M